MRNLLTIVFLFTIRICVGQEPEEKTVSLQQVLNIANKNLSATLPDSMIRQRIQSIKSTWYSLLFQIHKHNELEIYCDRFQDLGRIAELRYRAGETDIVETMDKLATVAQYNTEKDVTQNEISISHNLLKQLAAAEYEFVPADSTLSIYEIDKSHALTEAMTDSSYDNREFALKLENMNLNLDNLFIKLNYYTSFGLDYAETIVSSAASKFRAEEIDYYAFLEALTDALKIRLQYLECLYNYNQSAIQLEYYAY